MLLHGLEVELAEQRGECLENVRHGQIPSYAHSVSDAERNQVFALFFIVDLVKPAVGTVRFVVCAPDSWVVVEDVVGDTDACLDELVSLLRLRNTSA